MTASDEDVEAVLALVSAVKPFFVGESPQVQGAALADLTALWVAGHVTPDPRKTHAYWERTLALHLEGIWKLIPINYAGIVEPKLRKKRESEREHCERDSGADGADGDDVAAGEPSGA
jgi:hypothetical protein